MRELRADFNWRYGCILAKSLTCDGTAKPGASLLDFWRFRVSEIDPLLLPLISGHVTVWDDLFPRDKLESQLHSSLPEIQNHDLGKPSAYRVVLDPFDCLKQGIVSLLDDARFPRSSRCVAVVDLCSAGVGPLEWRDILPFLRCHYDVIVGIASIAGLGFADHHQMFGEDDGLWSQLSAEMKFCDVSFLTSDGLLGFGDALTANVRAAYLNNLIHELTHTLVSKELFNRVLAANKSSHFAIGATHPMSSCQALPSPTEHQRIVLAAGFCDPHRGGVFERMADDLPLVLGNVAFWPLQVGPDD
ncbi:hypothetical protein ACVIGB_001000 [Bradyrhizobium sp. USDA 4341]